MTAALAILAQVPLETVRKILAFRSAKPVTALAWRAKLSMRVAFRIQRFVMKLPTDELLPAREGVRFPLSDDEMRWHLELFRRGGVGISPFGPTRATKPCSPFTFVSANPTSRMPRFLQSFFP